MESIGFVYTYRAFCWRDHNPAYSKQTLTPRLYKLIILACTILASAILVCTTLAHLHYLSLHYLSLHLPSQRFSDLHFRLVHQTLLSTFTIRRILPDLSTSHRTQISCTVSQPTSPTYCTLSTAKGDLICKPSPLISLSGSQCLVLQLHRMCILVQVDLHTILDLLRGF